MKKLLLNFKNYDAYLKTWTKHLKNTCGGVNYVPSLQPLTLLRINILTDFFSRSSFMFLGRASLRNTTDWLLPKLYGPDYWVHNEVLTNIFFMIKKIFFAEWIYEYIKKYLYFVCNTNIFCIKIYFWNEIHTIPNTRPFRMKIKTNMSHEIRLLTSNEGL